MYRRSLVVLAQKQQANTGRTIVRDPRKIAAAKRVPALAKQHNQDQHQVTTTINQTTRQTPLPFQPSEQNVQSVGSTMASYALMGVGVTLGVVLVRVVLGF